MSNYPDNGAPHMDDYLDKILADSKVHLIVENHDLEHATWNVVTLALCETERDLLFTDPAMAQIYLTMQTPDLPSHWELFSTEERWLSSSEL